MAESLSPMEFFISNNLKNEEQSINTEVDSNYQQQKDFSTQWLKIQERNLLQLGENIVNPVSNSYLVYKCVTVISENVCTVPMQVFNKSTISPAPLDSPLYQKLYEPNPYDNYDDLMSGISTCYTAYGEAFIYINAAGGRLLEMWVVEPRLMKEVLDKNKMLIGWLYNDKIAYDLNEIVHIKRYNPYNPWRGMSPLNSIKTELNTDYKAGLYQESFFRNGAVPGGIITLEPNAVISEDEMKRIRKVWEQNFMGAKKGHKTAVLRHGMQFEPMSLNQQEMEFINSRKFTRESILMAFGVPSVVAGLTEGVNRTSADAQLRLFWRTTIKPQLDKIESKFNYDILPKYFPGNFIRFDVRKVDELQKDYTTSVKAAKDLFQMGFSRNELNYKFDLEFDNDTETGDIKYVPLNLVDASLRIYENETPGEEDSNTIDPEVNAPDDAKPDTKKNFLPKIKILTPKFNNFFLETRKKVIKSVINNKIDKNLLKILNELKNSEKIRFKKKFMPFMVQYKQELYNGENNVNLNEISDFMVKISGIIDTIFNKIMPLMTGSVVNEDDKNLILEKIRKIFNFLNKNMEEFIEKEVFDKLYFGRDANGN